MSLPEPDYRNTLNLTKLRKLVGLPTTFSEARKDTEFLEGGDHFQTTISTSAILDNARSIGPQVDHSSLTQFVHSQDRLISSLQEELQQCKTDLRNIRKQLQTSQDETKKLFNDFKTYVGRSMATKADHDQTEDREFGLISLPNKPLPPSTAEIQKLFSAPCQNCTKLQIQLQQQQRQEDELLERVRQGVTIAETLVQEKQNLESTLADAGKSIDFLRHENRLLVSQMQTEAAEQNRRLQEDCNRQREELREHESREAKLKLSLEILEETNKNLKQQVDSLRQQFQEHESKLTKSVKEMEETLSLSSREKRDLEDTCRHLNVQLERISELSKIKLSSLDKELSDTKTKLTEATIASDNARAEYQRLTEKATSLEQEIWQLNQEKRRLTDDLRNYGEQLAKDGPMKETIKNTQLQYERTLHQFDLVMNQQAPLVQKLLNQCRLLTDQLEQQLSKKQQKERSRRPPR